MSSAKLDSLTLHRKPQSSQKFRDASIQGLTLHRKQQSSQKYRDASIQGLVLHRRDEPDMDRYRNKTHLKALMLFRKRMKPHVQVGSPIFY